MLLPAMRARISLDADLRAPYLARRWLRSFGMPLTQSRADAAELLVAELVTASVKHAMADGLHAINISLRAEGGVVRVDVSDPLGNVQAEVPALPDDVTGFGFYLVDKLADRWGATRGDAPGLWFELDVYALPGGF